MSQIICTQQSTIEDQGDTKYRITQPSQHARCRLATVVEWYAARVLYRVSACAERLRAGSKPGNEYELFLVSRRELALIANATPKQDFKPQREHVLQMLQITREINERDKSLVSEHLGDHWRALGREMDFSGGQLDNIDNDHRRLQDKVYELLTLWQDDKSSDATFAQLVRLLMRIRAFELVSWLHKSLEF
ncbi:Death domain [Trinorchestia longiramus]|nr:Death domain [Trinorchestia longiramus]